MSSYKVEKIELNSDAVKEMLKSSEMQEICRELAEQVSKNYDGDTEVSVYVGANRCNASVYAETNNNDLLVALGGSSND